MLPTITVQEYTFDHCFYKQLQFKSSTRIQSCRAFQDLPQYANEILGRSRLYLDKLNDENDVNDVKPEMPSCGCFCNDILFRPKLIIHVTLIEI